MFAVVQLGANQFKISEGETVTANRMDFEAGQKITLDQVLLISDGKTVKVGQPFVKDAQIKATVVSHGRAPKVIAFKYRKRKDSARVRGHRQDLTTLKIDKIAL